MYSEDQNIQRGPEYTARTRIYSEDQNIQRGPEYTERTRIYSEDQNIQRGPEYTERTRMHCLLNSLIYILSSGLPLIFIYFGVLIKIKILINRHRTD
jgi:hypothetical protein